MILIELRTAWTVGGITYPAGSLLAANHDEFLSGTVELIVVFEPDEHTALNHYAWTADRLLMVTLADVASRVEIVTPGTWQRTSVAGIPDATNTVIVSADDTGDEFFLDSSGFDTPSRLMRGAGDGQLDQIKSAPAFFDAENITVTQHFVSSKDGTSIPYFVVRPDGTDGPGPTLLYGYGGFETSYTPSYSGVLGRLWLARGAPTCWPTSAAAASTGQVGTPRRCARAGTRWRRTSPPSPTIWSTGASAPSRNSAPAAAATAAC